mgnify:CR=1 FL=1
MTSFALQCLKVDDAILKAILQMPYIKLLVMVVLHWKKDLML